MAFFVKFFGQIKFVFICSARASGHDGSKKATHAPKSPTSVCEMLVFKKNCELLCELIDFLEY